MQAALRRRILMYNIVIRRTAVVSFLIALLCLDFLQGVFLTLVITIGLLPPQAGIMLIAPPYHLA